VDFLWQTEGLYDKLVRAACVRCHRTKCPLLTAFFLLSSLCFTFLPEGLIVGFWSVAWGLSHKKIGFGVKTFWGAPLPSGESIFKFFFLNRKVTRIAWNGDKIDNPPPTHLLRKISAGELSGGLRMRRPGAKTPSVPVKICLLFSLLPQGKCDNSWFELRFDYNNVSSLTVHNMIWYIKGFIYTAQN
jgi:hypothetical protein